MFGAYDNRKLPSRPTPLFCGWTITRDLIAGRLAPIGDGYPSQVGRTRTYREGTRKGAQRFRLLDDDGDVYYHGRLYDPSDRLTGFEPLGWASNYAGCTAIEYYERGAWVRL